MEGMKLKKVGHLGGQNPGVKMVVCACLFLFSWGGFLCSSSSGLSYHVTSAADSVPGSPPIPFTLRYAISKFGTSVLPWSFVDSITVALPQGSTINLNSALTYPRDKRLVIHGDGVELALLAGSSPNWILHVGSKNGFHLNDITFRGKGGKSTSLGGLLKYDFSGSFSGADIDLYLNNVDLIDSHSFGFLMLEGGVIPNVKIRMENCEISSNGSWGVLASLAKSHLNVELNNCEIVGNAREGVQIRQHEEGDLTVKVESTDFDENGYGYATSEGDALEVEEFGHGDVRATIRWCDIWKCKGEGFDISENHEGDAFVEVYQCSASECGTDAFAFKETGWGNIDVEGEDLTTYWAGDDGINVSEQRSPGTAVVDLYSFTSNGSGARGIALEEDDVFTSHPQSGGAAYSVGDGSLIFSLDEGDVHMQDAANARSGEQGIRFEENKSGDISGWLGSTSQSGCLEHGVAVKCEGTGAIDFIWVWDCDFYDNTKDGFRTNGVHNDPPDPTNPFSLQESPMTGITKVRFGYYTTSINNGGDEIQLKATQREDGNGDVIVDNFIGLEQTFEQYDIDPEDSFLIETL